MDLELLTDVFYSKAHILAPGAHARMPIIDRIQKVKVPVTFIYGDNDCELVLGSVFAIPQSHCHGPRSSRLNQSPIPVPGRGPSPTRPVPPPLPACQEKPHPAGAFINAFCRQISSFPQCIETPIFPLSTPSVSSHLISSLFSSSSCYIYCQNSDSFTDTHSVPRKNRDGRRRRSRFLKNPESSWKPQIVCPRRP